MNLLYEEDVAEKDKKNNKLSIIIIVSIVLVMLICMGIVGAIYYIKSQQFIFTINDKVQESYNKNLFVFENGKAYISIEALTNVKDMGYTYYRGEYNSYSENEDACYVQDAYGFESASYIKGSSKIYKNMKYKTNEYEYFDIDEPVIQIDGKLYTTIQGAKLGFNADIVYNEEKNRVDIYTIYYFAKKAYGEEAIKDMSQSRYEDFNNYKALLHGMKIVTEETSKKKGVYSLNNNVIIGAKYSTIEFMEATNEFKVTTSDNKKGIIDSKGVTKIKPEYDSIVNMDKDLKLYMVSNGRQYGVVTDTNNIVIHTEYDKIGIDVEKFQTNNIKNSYIMYNKCIPVQKDKKWGIFDISGNNILPVKFDELGCTSSGVKDKTTNSLLLIPKVEGIVVCHEKKYGVYDSQGNTLFPIVLDSIYSTTSAGIDEYYMMYEGVTYNALEKINQYTANDKKQNKLDEQNGSGLSEEDKKKYNGLFTPYEGEQNGEQLQELLEVAIKSNEVMDCKIVVKSNGNTFQEKDIANIQVDMEKTYNISFEYEQDGRIGAIIVE